MFCWISHLVTGIKKGDLHCCNRNNEIASVETTYYLVQKPVEKMSHSAQIQNHSFGQSDLFIESVEM